jgi:CBS domain-containing protein
MSPRAAWRLEAFGYRPVFDYTVGKADWLAAGLPTEGDRRHPPRVGAVMHRAVPTCTPGTPVSHVAARLDRDGATLCVVVNQQGVVQGRLRRGGIDPADQQSAGEVMEPGPATVRADEPLTEALERMRRRNVASLIVSTPDGVLLGVVFNQTEAEQSLQKGSRSA